MCQTHVTLFNAATWAIWGITCSMTADVSLGSKPNDQRFGARLALVRQYMGWGNVKEAALACRQPPESWRTWERDNVHPRDTVRISREISAATGCDYYWLLDGSTGQKRTAPRGVPLRAVRPEGLEPPTF